MSRRPKPAQITFFTGVKSSESESEDDTFISKLSAVEELMVETV